MKIVRYIKAASHSWWGYPLSCITQNLGPQKLVNRQFFYTPNPSICWWRKRQVFGDINVSPCHKFVTKLSKTCPFVKNSWKTCQMTRRTLTNCQSKISNQSHWLFWRPRRPERFCVLVTWFFLRTMQVCPPTPSFRAEQYWIISVNESYWYNITLIKMSCSVYNYMPIAWYLVGNILAFQ